MKRQLFFCRLIAAVLLLTILSGCAAFSVRDDAPPPSAPARTVAAAVCTDAGTTAEDVTDGPTDATDVTETACPASTTAEPLPQETLMQETEPSVASQTRITVPRMASRPFAEAQAILDDAGIAYTVSEEYSETRPAGEVITVRFFGTLDETHCHMNPAYPVEVVVSLGKRWKTNAVACDPKRIYLTFDDGPHPNTDKVLEILADYGVRATFFTLGTYVAVYPERTKAIVDGGHLLACHSYSHKYETLYASGEAVLAEIHAWEKAVEHAGVTVQGPVCFRFPGGTTTTYMEPDRYEEIFWTITDAGYLAFDWTFANNDRYLNYKTEDQSLLAYLQESVITTLNNAALCPTWPKIMLMHDTADETVESLRWVLEYLIGEGYTFGTLDELGGYWVFR